MRHSARIDWDGTPTAAPSPDIVWMVEPNGLVRFANRPIQLEREAATIKAGVPLLRCLPPPVRASWDAAISRLRAGETSAHVRLGSEPTDPVLVVRALDPSGDPDRGLVAIGSDARYAQDATPPEATPQEATAPEDRCETVAEITRSVVYERELARDEARVTGSMRALLGYDPAEAKAGGLTWWLSLVHPEDRGIVESRFADHREDRGVTWSVEYRVRRADASWAVVHDRGRSVPTTFARSAHILGVLSDVTDTRALRDEVQRSKRLEIVARLAAGVAHDYNNVLSAINGFTSVLIDSLEGQHEHVADLRQIETLVVRGASLSNNLLGLAKPRGNSRARLINVADEVRRIAPTVRILLGARIECSFETPPADRTIYIDPGSLDQVLLNLAANARDAMAEGGTLCIRTRIDDDGAKPRVRVEVEDTGCGIPPQVLSSIFQPYFTTKGERRGTGLGLWLVREIVQSAGGSIRVDSTPQVGTVVVLEFPAVDEPPSGEPLPLPRAAHLEKGLTLLFIEDEETVRTVTQRILERHGFRVFSAESGSLGLELLERHRHEIDAIITDLQMPGIAGPALVRRLRETAPEIGCIVMSGLADRLTDLTPSAGELELLGKPCEPAILVRSAAMLARATAERRSAAARAVTHAITRAAS